jgi:uncharacterized protein YndB with AHSA1/START domain
MSVTSVDQDFDSLTLTLIADFEAPSERVWQMWADPRQLEQWWGPPTYPATVEEHSLAPGGDVNYYMTGPEGDVHHGWWRIMTAEPPKFLEFTEGFADDNGEPVPDAPASTMQMRLIEENGGTRMELRAVFDSEEQMEQMMTMGMPEGLQEAVDQIDELLSE